MSRWSNVRFFAIVSITFATFICGRNDASAGVAVIDSVTHTHGAIDNVYISAHFDWTSSNAAAAWFIWEDKGADQVSFASDLGKGPAGGGGNWAHASGTGSRQYSGSGRIYDKTTNVALQYATPFTEPFSHVN